MATSEKELTKSQDLFPDEKKESEGDNEKSDGKTPEEGIRDEENDSKKC